MVVWPRDSGEERTGRVGLHLEVELTGLGGIRSGVLGLGSRACFLFFLPEHLGGWDVSSFTGLWDMLGLGLGLRVESRFLRGNSIFCDHEG